MSFLKEDFGDSFKWGVSSAAFQTEGAYNSGGKGLSNWDVFTQKRGKVHGNQHAKAASNFITFMPRILL